MVIEGRRRAFVRDTGEELVIGPPEKMSKSKKNVVDFADFMDGTFPYNQKPDAEFRKKRFVKRHS